MEARLGGEGYNFYGGVGGSSDLSSMGKRAREWNLNDWRWDGDLFIASRVNPVPADSLRVGHGQQFFPLGSGISVAGGSSNTSSSCSEEGDLENPKRNKEGERKRRVIVLEDDGLNEEAGVLSLQLAGHSSPVVEREIASWDGVNGKKSKVAGGASNRAVCQVKDCGADLSRGKLYHRRHKVCEMHSKASRALVGNAMQRFCQQCSRFHLLPEFDEGKRSCRRRLAGHNKRRRKTNNEVVSNGSPTNDDQTSNYLLISLLKILSNMHSDRSDQPTDQDLLTHLLRSLASQNDEQGSKNLSNLLQEQEILLREGDSSRKSEMVSALFSNGSQGSPTVIAQNQTVSMNKMQQEMMHTHDVRTVDHQLVSSIKPSISNSPPTYSEVRDSSAQIKMNNFDLNDIYIDSDDGMEDLQILPVSTNIGTSSVGYPWTQLDSHQSSPPQTSGNSDSASAQSPSSSSGETHSRTDRIVFKLFGKEPNEFPLVLRAQILDWLSHSPTDIESYIRPGCIVLTIYLRQAEAVWDDLCCDLTSSLSKLLDISDDTFWRTGWVHFRVQHQMAFIFNGQVVIDTSLPFRSNNYSKICTVSPIAVPASKRTQFSVKGVNLMRPATRLMCALEGNYLVCEDAHESTDQYSKDLDELQCIQFSCSVPVTNGRGFIEIEDQGLSSSFFPFIVAEEDVCSEICVLEPLLELSETDPDIEGTGKIKAKSQAMDFIHEMGWLLHRSQLKYRMVHLKSDVDLFPLERFTWLMEFSMDHDWCAVVKKLLNILLDETVNKGDHPTLYQALTEMGLLHRAVRRNSKQLVELLLRYVPKNTSDELRPEVKALGDAESLSFLFRPNAVGPAGLTPLHIAAGKDDSEDVLDALTNDPSMVGIDTWKNARDSTGSTPEDYARLRGHYTYIHLVQKKINKTQGAAHVVVEIPSNQTECNTNQKQKQIESLTGFEIGKAEVKRGQRHCKLCDTKISCRTAVGRSMVYRPAMLSMVAIAAVCVCWDLPQALEDEYGGWVSQRIIKDFTAYADICFREFGDRVKHWTTVNEGNACSIAGYGSGILQPQRCSSSSTSNCTKGNSSTEPYLVTHHMLLAHASATKLYRTKYKAKQKGFIGFNLIVLGFLPHTNTSQDIIAAQRARDFYIGWFLNPFIFGEYPEVMKNNVGSRLPYFTTKESNLVKGSIDFLGINFYYAYHVKNNAKSLQKKDRDYTSDTAAELTLYLGNGTSPNEIPLIPEILEGELHSLKNDYGNFPIYIHENGQQTLRNSSSLDDWSRVKCMNVYIGSLLDMLRNGLNIRGYFVWAFLDVFELLYGYEISFGLYYIDLKDPTLRRQPKLSSVWYSNFLNNRTIDSKITKKIEETSFVLSPNTPLMHATT